LARRAVIFANRALVTDTRAARQTSNSHDALMMHPLWRSHQKQAEVMLRSDLHIIFTEGKERTAFAAPPLMCAACLEIISTFFFQLMFMGEATSTTPKFHFN
jgi:hypothetical protein